LPEVDEGRAHALFNSLDNFAGLRHALQSLAERDGLWAGIPMPLEGRRLVIEPTFPKAAALAECGIGEKHRSEEERRAADYRAKYGDTKIRNTFWSFNRKAEVVVIQDPDGKVRHVLNHGHHAAAWLIDTMDCSSAWGLEQEHRAIQTLGTLLRHHIFKAYLLTGMFLESSPRSGLTYLFRRLRPAVVLDTKTGNVVRVRCTLCMHPIGYYEGTWAGAMTPTDDVIAQLMLMRGDEPMLWRRANQHPAWRPESGL
jgi:hypothetical protein